VTALVIDGYNVIYAIPGLRKKILKQGPQSARDGLIALCVQYRMARKDISSICIVFDGTEANSVRNSEGVMQGSKISNGVNVIFSRGEKEADDIIIDLLRKNQPASDFTVISSDNYVRNNSRIYSAHLMSPTAFCRALEKKVIPADKPHKKTFGHSKPYKSEITYWYKDELRKKGSLGY
jgi:predicted RNA-binding protein with PIN domain